MEIIKKDKDIKILRKILFRLRMAADEVPIEANPHEAMVFIFAEALKELNEQTKWK